MGRNLGTKNYLRLPSQNIPLLNFICDAKLVYIMNFMYTALTLNFGAYLGSEQFLCTLDNGIISRNISNFNFPFVFVNNHLYYSMGNLHVINM